MCDVIQEAEKTAAALRCRRYLVVRHGHARPRRREFHPEGALAGYLHNPVNYDTLDTMQKIVAGRCWRCSWP